MEFLGEKEASQNIFESKAEYQKYLKNAYNFLRGMKRGTKYSIIPLYLEIRLNINIRNQRLFLDKKKYDTLVIEIPVKKSLSPQKRTAIKSKALIAYGPLLATYEKKLADEFAITEKLFDMR